jgi:hypothetical protein
MEFEDKAEQSLERPCSMNGHRQTTPVGSKKRHFRTPAPQQRASLFNHLVGLSKQQRRHIGAEHLYGLEVDG